MLNLHCPDFGRITQLCAIIHARNFRGNRVNYETFLDIRTRCPTYNYNTNAGLWSHSGPASNAYAHKNTPAYSNRAAAGAVGNGGSGNEHRSYLTYPH